METGCLFEKWVGMVKIIMYWTDKFCIFLEFIMKGDLGA